MTQIKTAVIAAAIGLPLAALALLQVSYMNEPLQIAFESVAGFIALLAAFLTLGRATQSRQLRDLVLTGALTVMGVTNIVKAVIPFEHEAGSMMAEAGFLVGAAAFAAASFMPARDFDRLGGSLAAVALWLGAIVGGVVVLQDAVAHIFPTHVASQITMALFYGAAFAGFARRGARDHDQFVRWLGSGAVLAALARVNYSIPPYPVGDVLLPGDALRMGFYLLLMVAALHEIVDYWRQRARLTASEERRRIARELHDGLAQELFFIAAKMGILARKDAFPGAADVRDAAARALTESRLAIASLSSGTHEPLDVVLSREAEGVASRFHVELDMEMQQGLDASGDSHSALLRILREAVTNAVRHGHASRVKIRLAKDGGLRLSVTDDGAGFDPARVESAGFGLDSMRERVRALGGELRIDSVLGRGTVVEAVVP